MIVAPLGAHLGVFSVLQRLRSVILTFLSLLAVSPLCRGRNGRLSSRGRCQSPVQRAKPHRSTMYILLVLRERTSSVRFLCFCFAIDFILCLAFPLLVYHRCHIAFLGRDANSLLRLGAVCFVSFSPLHFRSVQRANVYILDVFFIWVWHRSHIAFLGRDIISLGGRVAEINQSTNQPYLVCLVSKSCSSPRGRATGAKSERQAKNYQ